MRGFFALLAGFLALVLLIANLSTRAHAQMTADYAARGRALVENLARGEYQAASAHFDATLAAAMPPAKLAGLWKNLQSQVGPFQAIVGVQVVSQGPHHVAVVRCHFAQADWMVQVAQNPAGQVEGLFIRPAPEAASTWAPPAYAQPDKFHEVPITVEDHGFQLPGTLTLPNGTGPFPAVVLVAGSGPADADETLGPNKPFKDLAWGLASQGVAVLRYEKRTKKYGGDIAPPGQPYTVAQESLDDARAAVALAAHRGELAPQGIYLLGHSLGGYLAPRIASGDPEIAGIIILAGPTRPLAESIVDQLRYLATLPPDVGGVPASAVAAGEASARAINAPGLKPDQSVSLLGASIPGAYFLDLRHYDPMTSAAKLTIPILVLQGGRDYQVTRADYTGWQNALAGHGNAQFQFFPDLDHLFMTAPGAGPVTPRDYSAPGHVAAPVLDAIAAFAKKTP